MATLSVEDLLTMSDAAVAPGVPTRFLEYLKAVPEVRPVFFADLPAPAPFPANVPGIRPLDTGWLKTISVALVCAAATRLVVRNFNRLVDADRVNAVLDRELAPDSPAAIAAGNAIYDAGFGASAASRNGTSFQAYLANGPAGWGTELANAVTDNAYRNQIDIRYGEATIDDRIRLGRHLELVSYMVGRLNPAERDRVTRCFAEWFPQATGFKPVSRLIRADYTPLTVFDAVSTVAGTRRYVPNTVISPMAAPPPQNYIWGEAFTRFLDREGGAYRTGVRPDDWEIVTIFSCFVRGTPVCLADGSSKPIEAVGAGDGLLAADGAVTVRASEDGERIPDAPQTIHGFNELPPFVSAGHTFLTATGPKAIDPEAAAAINPDVPVERLRVGDTLLRLVSAQPFAMEAVTVERITTAALAPGESLFALVVDGPQSYFAGGFLVAANYPCVTEGRIADGIEALSAAERAELRATLRPVMPLLMTVLRGFAGPRLTRLLTEDTQPEDRP
ncbi:hypothetical protein [Azospirillum halopraeferens]|uniref:hypothetical protein n=1 Tax=Azospirillum halopraeferens TaxID=34010 RepID=UPI0003F8C158|nr:hypothetical protein [Azospirillum halopraeferens]